MREFRTSGSVGASGGRPPEATRPSGKAAFRAQSTQSARSASRIGVSTHWESAAPVLPLEYERKLESCANTPVDAIRGGEHRWTRRSRFE